MEDPQVRMCLGNTVPEWGPGCGGRGAEKISSGIVWGNWGSMR